MHAGNRLRRDKDATNDLSPGCAHFCRRKACDLPARLVPLEHLCQTSRPAVSVFMCQVVHTAAGVTFGGESSIHFIDEVVTTGVEVTTLSWALQKRSFD